MAARYLEMINSYKWNRENAEREKHNHLKKQKHLRHLKGISIEEKKKKILAMKYWKAKTTQAYWREEEADGRRAAAGQAANSMASMLPTRKRERRRAWRRIQAGGV